QGIREPTPQELVLSKASADRAIEIATELDDPDLLSTALDATTGVSQATNDWAGGLESARRRIAFEERLGLYERLDAHSMVAWWVGRPVERGVTRGSSEQPSRPWSRSSLASRPATATSSCMRTSAASLA